MKAATCNFCGRSFRNAQAVRAHLKACAAYRQLPKGTLPIVGNKPRPARVPNRYPGVGPTWEDVPRPNPPQSQGPRIVAGNGKIDHRRAARGDGADGEAGRRRMSPRALVIGV